MKTAKLSIVLTLALLMPAQVAADNPDILLIAIDDLNDWVGPLGGHPQAKTPNIDRLASRGMTFTNAHVTAPLCNPSRASLMSGMLTSSFGVYVNRQDWSFRVECQAFFPVMAGITDEFCACPTRLRRRACSAARSRSCAS